MSRNLKKAAAKAKRGLKKSLRRDAGVFVEDVADIEDKIGKRVWCLHCERTMICPPDMECVYPDCNGDFMDLWPWEQIREGHPEYPETPEEGKSYPMY